MQGTTKFDFKVTPKQLNSTTQYTHVNDKPSIFFLSSSVRSATINTAEGNFFIFSNNTSTELN